MSDVKKSLLEQIAAKVLRKKLLKEEISHRSENVEAVALNMINEMEDMIATTVNTSLAASLAPLYAKSFESKIKVMDSGCEVVVQWVDASEGEIPRINGILIKWSKEYQVKNNCEEQLFVDVMSLLFK